jgi:hypothetical protein
LLQYRELDMHGRGARARKPQFSERLWMALFGGLALLIPVLIMTLVHGTVVNPVTTSVAILLFAFLLATWATNASGKIFWLQQLRMRLFWSCLLERVLRKHHCHLVDRIRLIDSAISSLTDVWRMIHDPYGAAACKYQDLFDIFR